MLLTKASNQLFSRPPDEHFESFLDLKEECDRSRRDGTEIPSTPAATFFVERDGDLLVVLANDQELGLTNYSLTQIAGACRVPVGVLERVHGETAARVLNETLPRSSLSDCMALAENGKLRALTSLSYSRLWDPEILEEIDRWLLPRGFIPAVPTMNNPNGQNLLGNTKPALFRGDRDSFWFFYSDQVPGDDGLGGLRKGLFVWNSEVGARAFGWSAFYFREVCANLLIWDVRDVRERRAIHKGQQLPSTWWRDFRLELIDASAEVEQHELDVFAKAAVTPFVGDGSPTQANKELAIERLQRQFKVPGKRATEYVQASQLPENPGDLSHWGIANGITSAGKDQSFAAGMVEAGELAGRVLGR